MSGAVRVSALSRKAPEGRVGALTALYEPVPARAHFSLPDGEFL